jgi:SAM-dependent methyltransferase
VYDRSAALYDAIYQGIGKDYAAESAEITRLIRGRRPDARTLLDVACGTGGHLQHLRDEFEVAGLEASPHMAELARAKLGDVAVHEGDMREFDLGRRFDAVTCLFSSIGYVRSPDELTAALSAMARHLQPGGVIVVDAWFTPDAWIDGHVTAHAASGEDLAVARVSTSHRLGRISLLDYHYTVATSEGVDRFTERHELALFRRDEYEASLREARLVDVAFDPDALAGRGRFLATVAEPDLSAGGR